ncbi:MAG: hypothetical protein KatS3mg090_0584 [Patescibacteria group bacterium]|nr:MAG: hypothetical protein KatS3mg090_0584 [Patescibacteria group bacterium]
MLVTRCQHNPILLPDKNNAWEGKGVFNASPVQKDNRIFILYRALSLKHFHNLTNLEMEISSIGIAESSDGINFENRRQLVLPDLDWDKYGCEDPRVTFFEGKYYIFYTALSGYPFSKENIKVGCAVSSDLKKVEYKKLITPFNAKAMTLFPERIGGKIWTALTIDTDTPPARFCIVGLESMEQLFDHNFWSAIYNNKDKYTLSLLKGSKDHLEVGSQPIKTEKGWLIFYSYIYNYFTDHPDFAIEAVLLSLDNPTVVLNRLEYPLLTAEEYYESYGYVPNIVFPSGALDKKDKIYLYYSSADTGVSLAFVNKDLLLNKLFRSRTQRPYFKRVSDEPLLTPRSGYEWESQAVFNPAALLIEDKIYVVYRAMSADNTSTMGLAIYNKDLKLEYRSEKPIYWPRTDQEQKLVEGGNSGCEDPRLVLYDNTVYMFYTAYNGKEEPRAAVSTISLEDFLCRNWNWSQPLILSYKNISNKDVSMFPEKINNKFLIIHRSGGIDMDISYHTSFDDFKNNIFLEEQIWVHPRTGSWDSEKVGLASTPFKTDLGWVVLYHGVSSYDRNYRLGAVLADLNNPEKIIGRTFYPLLEPELSWEREGIVNNVVFPCGSVVLDDKVYIFYGGADKVVGAAYISLDRLLDSFC